MRTIDVGICVGEKPWAGDDGQRNGEALHMAHTQLCDTT